MAPNSRTHQTVLIDKEQVKLLRALSKRVRYPMTSIVSYAVARLLTDKEALNYLDKGEVNRPGKAV